jgi:hypothetical protein
LFFENIYTITEEQREFMWTKQNYILPILQELYRAYKKDEQYWMGFFIVLSEEEGGKTKYSVWDAQHRITLLMLTIISIAYSDDISEKQREKILEDVCRWKDDDWSVGINEKNDKYACEVLTTHEKWTRVPNLRSEYNDDFECLGAIVNGLKPDDDNKSLLFSAYETICEFLCKEPLEDRKEFRKFIQTKIFIDKMVIHNKEFAYTVFYHINSIKVPLPLDVISKNRLLAWSNSNIDSEKLNDRFRNLKQHSIKLHYKINYILYLSCILLNKSVTPYSEFLNTGEILTSNNNLDDYRKLEETFDRLITTIYDIKNHPLIFLIDNLTKGHEIFTNYLIPLIFLYPKHIDEIMDLLISASVRRNLVHKKKIDLNSKRYQQKLFHGTEEKPAVMENILSKNLIWKAAKTELINFWHTVICIEKNEFVLHFFQFAKEKNDKIFKCLLQYIWLKTDSHESVPSFESTDLEHIIPQAMKQKKELPVSKCIDYFGNLTLFVGANSGSVKGNRALKDKPFLEKIEMYKKSNLSMTRELGKYEHGFEEKHIEERGRHLTIILEKITREVLEI